MFNLDTRSVTFNLIAVNVLLFIGSMLMPGLYDTLSLHYFANPGFKPLQIITHMFMHSGIGHIFFNMFSLFMFGAVLERVWGQQRFLLFYVITGLGAEILHVGVQAYIMHSYTGSFFPSLAELTASPEAWSTFNSITLGASGAVYGVCVAFAMLFPNTELYIYGLFPVKAKYLTAIMILLEVYLGFANHAGDNVAHFAHLGGALFGFLLVKYWNKSRTTLY